MHMYVHMYSHVYIYIYIQLIYVYRNTTDRLSTYIPMYVYVENRLSLSEDAWALAVDASSVARCASAGAEKETHNIVKRDLQWCQKRPTIMSKQTYGCGR